MNTLPLDCFQDIKTLLLKTPHTLIAGYRETKLEMSRKLPPYWLTFVLPDGVMEVIREKKSRVLTQP